MKKTLRYGLVCLLLVVATVVTLGIWLDAPAVRGLATAGSVAWAVQIAVFGLLVHGWERQERFLAAWVGGMLARLAAVAAVAWVVVRRGVPDPAATLLGLAGFLFAMLLLEPVFLRPGSHTESTTRK